MTLDELLTTHLQEIKAGHDARLREGVVRLINEARIDAVIHIMSAKTEGLFDGPDLFIKRAPIEQACIDIVGFETFKAIKDSLPKATPDTEDASEVTL